MTHLPKHPYCEVCARATVHRKQTWKNVIAIETDATAEKAPAKFGDQVTGDRLIKNDDEEDYGVPLDIVAVVLLDMATR